MEDPGIFPPMYPEIQRIKNKSGTQGHVPALSVLRKRSKEDPWSLVVSQTNQFITRYQFLSLPHDRT